MPAIILDRDGVINHDSDAYIKTLAEWRPIPGSIEAIARLSKAGWTIAICSNQSGIARGLISENAINAMHAKLHRLVRYHGGSINGIYICPHGPDDHCACRKPLPGLLLQAGQELDFSLVNVPVVGDSTRDLTAARSVNARPLLVKTGNGLKTLADNQGPITADIHDNLATAIDALLLEQSRSSREVQ